jgi:hypothetical protein
MYLALATGRVGTPVHGAVVVASLLCQRQASAATSGKACAARQYRWVYEGAHGGLAWDEGTSAITMPRAQITCRERWSACGKERVDLSPGCTRQPSAMVPRFSSCISTSNGRGNNAIVLSTSDRVPRAKLARERHRRMPCHCGCSMQPQRQRWQLAQRVSMPLVPYLPGTVSCLERGIWPSRPLRLGATRCATSSYPKNERFGSQSIRHVRREQIGYDHQSCHVSPAC